jgi:GNAT superfamily N-acetyltransferase
MNIRNKALGRVKTATELGLLNSIVYLAKKTLGALRMPVYVQRYYLIAQPVAAAPRLPPHRGQNIHVRRLERDDPAAYGFGRPDSVIRGRFAQGAICFGAFQDGRLIGYLWLVLGPYIEDEVRCRFTPAPVGKAAWDFDVYLEPQYRAGVAFARLWDAADAFLRERGVGWTMSRISAFNPGSLASHARLGAQRLGSATFVGSAYWQLTLAGVPPYVHVALGPNRRPNIRLAPAG